METAPGDISTSIVKPERLELEGLLTSAWAVKGPCIPMMRAFRDLSMAGVHLCWYVILRQYCSVWESRY